MKREQIIKELMTGYTAETLLHARLMLGQDAETIRKRNLLVKDLRKQIEELKINLFECESENQSLMVTELYRTQEMKETVRKMLKEQGKIVE